VEALPNEGFRVTALTERELEDESELDAIRLPRLGAVAPTPDAVAPFVVLDAAGRPVEPIRRFLRDFVARGRRTGSVRSYAYALLRWWRWLIVIEVEWDRATSAEVREFVLWLQRTTKPRRSARTKSEATGGTVNPITRKTYLDDRYQPRTVRHSNATLRAFYEFWIERGEGPLVNPVPQERKNGRRPNAHHNPLEPFRPQVKLRYNPPVPKRRPRVISDQRWGELFAALRSDRDRAIVAIVISNGIRAAELLGRLIPTGCTHRSHLVVRPVDQALRRWWQDVAAG
jgi:integrase/recombinase XerD